MARESVKNGKLLYHLTNIDNLDSILEKGLLPRNMLSQGVKFDDIADGEILIGRDVMGLRDYIPFHFHPYSSFDVAVKNRYPEKEFIYICITRELAMSNNFKILTNHPLSQGVLSDYDVGFQNIDWDAMDTLGTEVNYIKQVKMAECLTDLIIPGDCFQSIAVKDNNTRRIVEDKLRHYGIVNKPPYVDIRKWF